MVMSVNRLPTGLGGGDAEVVRAAVTPTASATMAPAKSPARTRTDRWMRWMRFITTSFDTAAASCPLSAAAWLRWKAQPDREQLFTSDERDAESRGQVRQVIGARGSGA